MYLCVPVTYNVYCCQFNFPIEKRKKKRKKKKKYHWQTEKADKFTHDDIYRDIYSVHTYTSSLSLTPPLTVPALQTPTLSLTQRLESNLTKHLTVGSGPEILGPLIQQKTGFVSHRARGRQQRHCNPSTSTHLTQVTAGKNTNATVS